MGKGFLGGYIRAYRGLIATLANLAMNDKALDMDVLPYGDNPTSSAFYYSEAIKARTLLEAIAESANGFKAPDVDWNLRRKEKQISNRLTAIESLREASLKMGEEEFHDLERRKTKLKMDYASLIFELREKYPRYAALKYPKPVPPEDLTLRSNEILLEYAITDNNTYLFVVERGKVKEIVKIKKGREEVKDLVEQFLSLFNREFNYYIPMVDNPHKYEKKFLEKGKTLYELLLAEALKGLSPEKNIIIVPDGILGLVPFEALVMKKGGNYRESQYVGDKWKITYSQSATVLALNRLLKDCQAEKPLFTLGNPIYSEDDKRYIAYKKRESQSTNLASNKVRSAFRALATRREWGKTTKDEQEVKKVHFDPLPGTKKEVKKIAKDFGVQLVPPDILLGISANESNLRKSPLNNYRYLHFATHASLSGHVQEMNEPFLVLGQVENKEPDDGLLTMTEVLELDLDADMVVLSACLTGRGKVMEGEGVLNFARAFQQAGARSVVVSLWEVASDATVEYMKSFYQNLKEGKSKAEALRLARNEIKKKYPNPFYWAPFILHGER